MKEYSTQELRERAELTDRIVANLKVIDEYPDIEEMCTETASIISGLETINKDPNDLDELDRLVGGIVGGLRVINEDQNNLDELVNDTETIVGNLREIAKAS
jgi:hypothetical protein